MRVLSSHLIEDLERACDYLIVLANGRVQVAGRVPTCSPRSSPPACRSWYSATCPVARGNGETEVAR